MNTKFAFSYGENLIITSDGHRQQAASYLTTENARRRIFDEKQEKPVSTLREELHKVQRALFKWNMHRPSYDMIDKIFKVRKSHYVENTPRHNRAGNVGRPVAH